MWVSQKLQIFNFSLDSPSHITADELLARNNLESDLLASAPMDGQLDLAKRAFTQRLDNIVLADSLVSLDLLGRGAGSPHGWMAGGCVCIPLRIVALVVDDNIGSASGRIREVDPASSHLRGAEGDGELGAVVVDSLSRGSHDESEGGSRRQTAIVGRSRCKVQAVWHRLRAHTRRATQTQHARRIES